MHRAFVMYVSSEKTPRSRSHTPSRNLGRTHGRRLNLYSFRYQTRSFLLKTNGDWQKDKHKRMRLKGHVESGWRQNRDRRTPKSAGTFVLTVRRSTRKQ